MIRPELKAGGGPDLGAILGMETPSAWSTVTPGAVLGQSSTHSQGSYSLSVRPSNSNGYTPIRSVALTTLPVVSPTLAVDIMLPWYQPNPNWYGTSQAYIDCPSRGIYSQFLGQVELTGKPRGVWNTVSFTLTNSHIAGLLQAGYSDLTITVVVNVQVPTTGIYLVDNLRFLPAPVNGCGGRPNGTSCTDNNACTLGDTCQSGACHSGSAVPCTASDQCHAVGTCNPATGMCSDPPLTGTDCTDGNPCTQGDQCQAGACIPGAPRTCPGDQCNQGGTCDPATGECSTTPVTGAPCDDGVACTQGDTCQSGVCVAGPAATLTGLSATSLNQGLQIALSWDPYPGATIYNVKRSTTSGGPYTPIGSTAEVTFTDSDFSCLTAQYYVVTAVSSCGETPDTGEVSSAPEQHVTPTVLCVNRFSATSWNAVFGYANASSCATTIQHGPFNRLDPASPESDGLPTTFLAGTHQSVFMASFPGGSLTWTLGAGQATADESLPRCSVGDLPPPTTPPLPVGVGDLPDNPSVAALATLDPDINGPHSQADPVPGGPVTVQYDVQGGRESLDASDPAHVMKAGPGTEAAGVFEFTIFRQMMGDDIGAEVETDIDIYILNVDGTIQKHVKYDNPDDWGNWSWHEGNWPISDYVAPERADVVVRVSINEYDVGDTDHWVRRVKFDNRTGELIAVMDDNNNELPRGPLTDCIGGVPSGWGFCWEPVTVTGQPKLCARLKAEYLDSGYGQYYLEPWGEWGRPRDQAYLAAYAYAKYRITSNVNEHYVGGVRVPERTVNAETSGYFALDRYGCVPTNLALKGKDVQYDPNGKLEIELRVRSEFCLDETGNNCPTDPNNSGRTTSGIKYQIFDSNSRTRDYCVIWTSDESLTNPDCEVIHASQGAFDDWAGNTPLKYAPERIEVIHPSRDSITRIGGVVSTLYKRALDSPMVSGAILQPHRSSKVILGTTTDVFCKLSDVVGTNRKAVDTCAGSFSPSFRCDPGQPMGECAWWDTTNNNTVYTPCEVGPSDPSCRPNLTYFKTGVAHEIGHQVHGANQAMPPNDYSLNLPGMPRICTCDHVQNANRLHCPQSVETWSAGLVEGFAHAFAVAGMNRDNESDCTFLYEKEIASEDCFAANGAQDCSPITIDGRTYQLAKTPVKVNCDVPYLWRNKHCLTEDSTETDIVANTAVELDVMAFLRAVWNTGTGDERISNADFINFYKKYIKDKGKPDEVSWEGSSTESSYREAVLEHFGGNERDPHYNHAVDMADNFGVSKTNVRP